VRPLRFLELKYDSQNTVVMSRGLACFVLSCRRSMSGLVAMIMLRTVYRYMHVGPLWLLSASCDVICFALLHRVSAALTGGT
jgi:hypothetical protein